MKPSRNWLVWAALGACAVIVIGAMIFLTYNVRASQRERAAAEARADLEEQTRLALWRMDGAGAAILLRENQRPAADYGAKLLEPDPRVKIHFEVRGGRLMAAEAGQSAELLRLLAKNGDLDALLKHAAIPNETAIQPGSPAATSPDPQNIATNNAMLNVKRSSQQRYNQDYQDEFNRNEMAQRAKVIQSQVPQSQALENGLALSASNTLNTRAAIGGIKGISSLRPLWIDGELFLLRQLEIDNPQPPGKIINPAPATTRVVQGVWLDANAVRRHLLSEVADLLPAATLVAMPSHADPATASSDDPLALASFPFRLQRNESIRLLSPPWNGPLVVGWTAVLCALGAVVALVRGVMRLSERRASFVSAVTHELRTPLTTFRLYSDMLESGAVREDKRGDYLRVLSREADRLSHLVENVLAFSRIERGNARSNVRDATTGELLERLRERFEARLATAGLTLDMDSACADRVRVDTAAVEHILFNLIDNAAKYAANSTPPIVTIRVQNTGRAVAVTVCDHGPGIPPAERGRIFRAFHKSAREAAESQPGVGLGLALSRRLAKAQGGSLECADSSQGACFILRLPAA